MSGVDTNVGHEEYRLPAAAQAGFVNVKLNLMVVSFSSRSSVMLSLSRVMAAYSKRKELDFKYIKFLFDGQQMNPNHTPDKLDMEEGDIIDVVQSQDGGSGYGGSFQNLKRMQRTTTSKNSGEE